MERSPAELETIRGDLEVLGVPAPSGKHHTLLTRGASLGRYLVLDTLGVGGVGVVVSAYDPELDRKVAVKLVRPTADGGEHAEDRARLDPPRAARGAASRDRPDGAGARAACCRTRIFLLCDAGHSAACQGP